MKYKSGDVQNILGISSETLRFFESKGLIEPERNEFNNYRYYDTLDLNKIVAYKMYRGLEYSMDESLEMLLLGNEDQIERHRIQKEVIREKLAYYKRLYERVSEIHENYLNIIELTDNFRIEESPEVLLYYNQTNDEFEISKKIMTTNLKWLEHLPFVNIAFHISLEDKKLSNNVQYGYAVKTLYPHVVEDLTDCCNTIYPSRKSVHGLLKISDREDLTAEHFDNVLVYINEQHLKISGDIIGWVVNEEVLEIEKFRYFEIWIPVA